MSNVKKPAFLILCLLMKGETQKVWKPITCEPHTVKIKFLINIPKRNSIVIIIAGYKQIANALFYLIHPLSDTFLWIRISKNFTPTSFAIFKGRLIVNCSSYWWETSFFPFYSSPFPPAWLLFRPRMGEE